MSWVNTRPLICLASLAAQRGRARSALIWRVVVNGDHPGQTQQYITSGLLFYLQNPAAAVVKTLTLVLGEYELGGFLETDFPDEYSRAFSVALLVILAIIGSLVMVNLFVAIIVSDIEDLRAKGLMQESVIKAQHIVSKISTPIEYRHNPRIYLLPRFL